MPFPAPVDPIFLSFFHGWNRLEARSRRDEFIDALAAPVADPLWLLGRQWQFRELDGEDAATPIQVRATFEATTLDQIRRGANPAEAIDATPVEVLVEREAIEWDWRKKVQVGQQFERLTRAFYAGDAATAAAIINGLRLSECRIDKPTPHADSWVDTDNAARRFLAVVAGRAIDGEKLIRKLRTPSLSVTATLAIAQPLADEMLAWYDKLYLPQPTPDSPAWRPAHLDYEFRLQSQNADVPGPLRAPSYRNGSLDWDTFALERQQPTALSNPTRLHLTPTHAQFAGQPMRRWWEFENAAVNLGSLDVAKTDLAKLALMQFALIFGDDWFVIPIAAKSNSLVRVTRLEVRDCFGQATAIPPARDLSTSPLQRWQVFALAPAARGGQFADFLYVPPAAGTREESVVLEEVRFARDEDANVVFGIEATVRNQVGDPESGFAAHLEQLRRRRELSEGDVAASSSGPASSTDTAEGGPSVGGARSPTDGPGAAADPTAPIRFVLSTKVPENWIPFIATDANLVAGLPQKKVMLRRAMIVPPDAPDGLTPIEGRSRLLKEGSAPVDWIYEDAVGREGVRVELRLQRKRDVEGNTYVWLGRKIGVGRGEARSGLRFDVTREVEA